MVMLLLYLHTNAKYQYDACTHVTKLCATSLIMCCSYDTLSSAVSCLVSQVCGQHEW